MEKEMGKINISEEVIAIVAGFAAVESYGIVGMTARKIKEGFAELLGRENLTKGIDVKLRDDQVIIDLYVVVSYGTKINQVAQNVMEKVRYNVENITGLTVQAINVNIQGVRVDGK